MKKSNSLLGATLSVSLLAVFVKLLGFVREALIAAYYGATAETDAFFFAEGMPNTFFPAVGSSLALAFTSLYIQKRETKGEEISERYASRMICMSALLGVILGVLGAAASPLLVPLFAPGFSGKQQELAIVLTRLIMGTVVLTVLQYMLSAVLNAKKHFMPAQIAALSHNMAIIAIIVLFTHGHDMVFLMIAVIAGMAVQVAVLLLCCCRHFTYIRGLSPFHRDTWHLFRMAFPVLLGNSIIQINNIVDKALGSTLPEGSLSALNYANNLTAFVISVFITSLATTLYPTLAAKAAEESDGFGKALLQSIGGLSLVLIPISCITVIDAKDIVSVVYARGSFDQTAVFYTALALSWYAPMFPWAGIRDILTRAFYAVQNTKIPMRNSAVGVGCNIMFSLLFVRWLGLVGIALGTAISSVITAVLLLWNAHKYLPSLRLRPLFWELGKQFLAGIFLLTALLIFRRFSHFPHPAVQFTADTIWGFICYFLALRLLGSEELRIAAQLVQSKLRRS